MGKHWWDEFVDKGEELWDGAKKTVGEIVDKATDVAGDALDAVGLDSWAKAVEDFGDQVASELGATPGEKNLGESDDPKDLVHGDAGALRGAGEKVTSFATHFEQGGNGLRGISTGEFEGKSAEAYHATINAEIPKWFKAADAMKKASTGFSDMAQAVEFGQKKAAEAIRLYKEAKTKHDEWQKKADAYNDAVDRRNGGEDVTLPEKPGDDPGPALLQQAKDTLKEGRKHRNEIAEKVAKTWNDAAAEAPELPPGFQRLVNDISDLGQAAQSFKTHFTVGLLGGLTDMVKTVRTVNPTDPYNLAHPADYVNNATAVAAGLSDVVANPEKLVTGLIGDGWSTDPGQALGTLTSNFIPLGPPGAGVAAGLAKVGLKTAITDAVKGGVKDAVRTGAKDTAATSARDAGSSAVRDSRSGAHVTETPSSHTNTPATHTADAPAPQQHGTPTERTPETQQHTTPTERTPETQQHTTPTERTPETQQHTTPTERTPETQQHTTPTERTPETQQHTTPTERTPETQQHTTPTERTPETQQHTTPTERTPETQQHTTPTERTPETQQHTTPAQHAGPATERAGGSGHTGGDSRTAGRTDADGKTNTGKGDGEGRSNTGKADTEGKTSTGKSDGEGKANTAKVEADGKGEVKPNAGKAEGEATSDGTKADEGGKEVDPKRAESDSGGDGKAGDGKGDGDGSEASASGKDGDGRSGDGQGAENGNDPVTQAGRDADAGVQAEKPEAATEPKDVKECGDPVDIATGEYLLSATDIALPGVLPLIVRRRHRSQYRWGVWFGPSWSCTFDARVSVTQASVTTIDADGAMLSFAHPNVREPQRPLHGRDWMLFALPEGGYRLYSVADELSFWFEPKPQLAGTDLAVGSISISAISDRHGNRIEFRYSDNGIPVELVHSGGYRITVHSDGRHITGYDLIDPASGAPVPLRRFDYHHGNLVAVTDGCGAITSFAYDDAHQMTAWMDSVGTRYDNTYDESGRVVSQSGSNGILAGTFDYLSTPDGQVTTYTDAIGAPTVYGIDTDGRARKVMDPQGRVTTTGFNARRDPLSVTDNTGATTEYRYTAAGDIETITNPLGQVTAFTYARPHRPSRIESDTGPAIELAYDQTGNLTSVTSDGATRHTQYNHTGAVIASIDEEGRRTTITVNAAGLPTVITDADGNATTIEYDMFGRVRASTDALGNRATVVRDTEGRVIRQTDAAGATESWAYDGEGNPVAHTDSMGQVTRLEYLFDKLAARIAPDGSRTQYRYDAALQLVEVIDPQGLSWTYTYNRDGTLASETDFNGATTQYRYDDAGRLAEKINAEGQSVLYIYDALGRVLAETTSTTGESDKLGASSFLYSGEITQYTYGPDGALVQATNVHGTGTYQHDRRYQQSNATWNGRSVVSALNLTGQIIGVTSPSGVHTGYTYDQRGALSAVVTAGRHLDLTLDAAGWITDTSFGATTVNRAFDPLGRLLHQTWTGSSEGRLTLGASTAPSKPQLLTQSHYTYRPDGALTTTATQPARGEPIRTDINVDVLGRVTQRAVTGAATEHYSYDPTNNITTATGDVATPTEASDAAPTTWRYSGTLLLDDGRSRYTYDTCGRLTQTVTKRLGRKPDVWRYRWDAYDRLREVTTPNGHIWAYGYDPAGRRTHKINTTIGDVTTFTWHGNQLLEQITHDPADTDGVPETITWTYLPGAITPIAQTHTTSQRPDDDTPDVPFTLGASTTATSSPAGLTLPPSDWSQPEIDRAFYAIATDQLGTPTHLIDPTTTHIAGHATATLWGQTRWTGDVHTPLRFPGQYHDPETGWHYNRHRYYQPTTGRYTTPDPLGLTPAPNPHTYPTNPTTHTDPLGLTPCEDAAKSGTANQGGDGTEFPPSTHGYGVNDTPKRLYGPWTQEDLARMMNGAPPRSYGFPHLHHADQMPGSAIHEVPQEIHRRPELHPNAYNQGVTNEMRAADRKLHWMMRAMEMGWVKK